MKDFFYKLELIIMVFIISITLASGVSLYFFIQYITQDIIYKEAYDIVKERELINENN